MKIIKRTMQNIRRKWLEYRLNWLIKEQVQLDSLIKELQLDYALQTNALAAKRTTIRTALIRMKASQ